MTALSLSPGRLQEVLVDFLFPRHCVACGVGGEFLCARCLRGQPRVLPPFCHKCGKPGSSGGLCPGCWGWQSTIDGIRSPFRFDGAVRLAIHELKYRNLKAIARDMAQLLADYLQVNAVPGDVLVPVPLHSRRLRQRGYNQSSLLVAELAKLIGLPPVDNCLVRIKDSLPQARTATVERRQSNVADAFRCRDGRLKGRDVILIDDVCTSGATLEACAVALKAAGVSSVWGLTLAREA